MKYHKRRYFQAYQLSIYKLTPGFNLAKKSIHNTKYTWSTFCASLIYVNSLLIKINLHRKYLCLRYTGLEKRRYTVSVQWVQYSSAVRYSQHAFILWNKLMINLRLPDQPVWMGVTNFFHYPLNCCSNLLRIWITTINDLHSNKNKK